MRTKLQIKIIKVNKLKIILYTIYYYNLSTKLNI